jgi:GTP-binding protein HflX
MNIDDFNINTEAQASLVSIVCEKFENHSSEKESLHSLEELRELCRTLGLSAGKQYIQNRKSLDPATLLGKGKLLEIAEQAKAEGSDFLVFDFELTASQARNIKKLTDMDVIDRCNIILEIFAKHAHTKEAKIQIEISRLQYLLPRLSSLWTHFSKQKGGIGLKGEGEQQLELDRRIVRRKIEKYKQQLEEVKVSRKEQRKKRKNKAVTAALVGYTNAGKSSIMNKMCKVDVLSEDKLFATLDSTFRMLNPDTKPPMILIDTVGFIQNLPNTLIEGFKTTLESALEADLIIVVCDISDPNYQKHLQVTEEVLNELNITDKERIIVFNKRDKLPNPFEGKIKSRNYLDSFLVSSKDKDDIEGLRKYIIEYFLSKQNIYDVFIPYELGGAHSKVLGQTNILTQTNHELGIFYRVQVPDFIFNGLGLTQFVLSPEDPNYSQYAE